MTNRTFLEIYLLAMATLATCDRDDAHLGH